MLPLSAPRPGHDFGAYQLLRTIGEGGMGTVYEATHKALQKRVAIKILLPKLANNEESVSRFLREGRATSAINHPNVVGVFDVGVHENMPYLVMEYLEGETLAARLKRERKLSPKDVSDILVPILAGLAVVHDKGIVHRDLKPDNIFLSRAQLGDLQPKLLDFGISKMNEGQFSLTQTQALVGTPLYMSPEQARGDDLDGRSDLYSAGVLLFEALSGEHPIKADSLLALIDKVCSANIRSLHSLAPDVPKRFADIVHKALKLEPNDRYPSAGALAAAILPFTSGRVRVVWEPILSQIGTSVQLPAHPSSSGEVIDASGPQPKGLRSTRVATPSGNAREANPEPTSRQRPIPSGQQKLDSSSGQIPAASTGPSAPANHPDSRAPQPETQAQSISQVIPTGAPVPQNAPSGAWNEAAAQGQGQGQAQGQAQAHSPAPNSTQVVPFPNRPTPTAQSMPLTHEPARPQLGTGAVPAQNLELGSGYAHPASSPFQAPPPTGRHAPVKSSSKKYILGSALLILAGLAAGVASGFGGGNPASTTEVPVADSRTQSPVPPPPVPTMFQVNVRTVPDTATIELDGQPMGVAAMSRSLPINGSTHRISVRAPGYEPLDVDFVDAPPPAELRLTPIPTATPTTDPPAVQRHRPGRHRPSHDTQGANGALIIQ